MDQDRVDVIIEQWRNESPSLEPLLAMEVVGRVLRIAKVFDQEILRVVARHDLNFGEFDVLACLLRSGPPYELTPGQLLETMMLTSGAMTNRVDGLEKAGLVKRKPDPEDRRGVRVGLTGKGKKIIGRAVVEHVENEKNMLDALSETEQRRLAGLLRKLLVKYGR